MTIIHISSLKYIYSNRILNNIIINIKILYKLWNIIEVYFYTHTIFITKEDF